MKNMMKTRPKATVAILCLGLTAASQIPRPSNCLQRRLRWLLCSSRVVLLLLAWPAVVQAQFNYTTNNGTITLTGYTGSGSAVTIPAIITGRPVTSIGDSAFLNNSFVTSVTIPNRVTNIGNGVFSGCNNLTAITVDALNTGYISVGGVLFNKDQTALIQYPAGKAGSQYTIPKSVTTIGVQAFFGCFRLTAITVDALNSVITIGDQAFSGCVFLTSATIGNSVTSIGSNAFASCVSLTNITIPNSVASIGDHAFYSCFSLTNIMIGNSVTSIGDWAFYYCLNLSAITVDALNPAHSSVDGVLFNKNQTALIQYPAGKAESEYTIPNSVATIGIGAFAYCALTSVTIPNGTTSIGDDAFYVCFSLNGVYFQGNPPSVGSPGLAGFDATVYYLPGTTGWGPTFDARPTALWKPQIQASDTSFGVRTNQFGFNISWASGRVVVVEACTNLANPIWSPISTNTLTGGSAYFSDPKWANYPSRFYQLRSP